MALDLQLEAPSQLLTTSDPGVPTPRPEEGSIDERSGEKEGSLPMLLTWRNPCCNSPPRGCPTARETPKHHILKGGGVSPDLFLSVPHLLQQCKPAVGFRSVPGALEKSAEDRTFKNLF